VGGRARLGTRPPRSAKTMTTEGLDVSGALVGERWRIRTTLLEVVEPLLPWFKLGLRMGDPSFVRRLGQASRPGSHLRILEDGELGAGDAVDVDLARLPDHGVTVRVISTRSSSTTTSSRKCSKYRSYVRSWGSR
jgi:MOSC domain-containing protein YiiM